MQKDLVNKEMAQVGVKMRESEVKVSAGDLYRLYLLTHKMKMTVSTSHDINSFMLTTPAFFKHLSRISQCTKLWQQNEAKKGTANIFVRISIPHFLCHINNFLHHFCPTYLQY